jgi:hypothetical protein
LSRRDGVRPDVYTLMSIQSHLSSDMYGVTSLSRRDGVRAALGIYLTRHIVLDCRLPHCLHSLLPRLPSVSLSPLPPTSTA